MSDLNDQELVAASRPTTEWTVAVSELAGRILTDLGFGTCPSMEPGADPRRDRIAALIAGAQSAQSADVKRMVEALRKVVATLTALAKTPTNEWLAKSEIQLVLIEVENEARAALELATLFPQGHHA